MLRHPETPLGARLVLGLALLWLLSPIDPIPDFLPVVGHLDDLIFVPLLVATAMRMVPREVVAACRADVDASTR